MVCYESLQMPITKVINKVNNINRLLAVSITYQYNDKKIYFYNIILAKDSFNIHDKKLSHTLLKAANIERTIHENSVFKKHHPCVYFCFRYKNRSTLFHFLL